MNPHRDDPVQPDEETLRRWYAASSRATRIPTAELLSRGERRQGRRSSRRSLAVAAVAVILVVAAAVGTSAWARLRSGPAELPTAVSAASSAPILASTTPSPEPQRTGLAGPALATGEQIIQMGRTATGGWLLTPTRLLVTDGSSWRDCWLAGNSIGRSMPGLQVVFANGVIHARVSATLSTSADGCASWSEATLPVDPTDMAFPTANVGYIVGGDQNLPNPKATIFKTGDGGMHWTAAGTIGASNLSMSFADAEHGWVTDGSTLWTTADGARTWSRTALPKPTSVSGKLDLLRTPVAEVDGGAVVAAKYDATPGMDGAPGQEVFYRTVDFGVHWTVASIIADPGALELSLIDPATWVALDPTEPATVRITTDAGSTWQTTAVRQRWPFTSDWIDFADALHGWLVVSEPYPPCAQPSGMPNVVAICDYAYAPPQHLVVTNDGGATWVELKQ
jgi:photosystem II stability/assembly factor-like uncharacterized protein